ncbi:signal peptidase I [Frankia sp. CcI49]|uniref:signal peptidase I n=1 Tax=Frankia sp. CcI49 TaxID=1745382 RepID=UPI0009776A1B|nr:signal peptidase I [Frankia sp. CcI49]ONH60314.1 signal peptidase I [Frankia sp. CcI49]
MSGSDRGTPEPFDGSGEGDPASAGPGPHGDAQGPAVSGMDPGVTGSRPDPAAAGLGSGADDGSARPVGPVNSVDVDPAEPVKDPAELVKPFEPVVAGVNAGIGGGVLGAAYEAETSASSGPEERGRDEHGSGASPATGRRVARPDTGRDRGRGSFLRELPILVLVAFLLALLIKTVFVQAFWIPSESMERTLLIDDRVLVNKVIYHFQDVHRGEIVVFNGEGTGFERESVVSEPGSGLSRFVRNVQELLGLGAPSEKDFIKRVIGVGGDVVACCDDAGRVTVNGKALDEPYVYENDFQEFGPITVPDGDLWLMGDHRSRSSDSRQNGPVPQDKVIGRAFVRVWPLGRFGILSVPDTFSGVPSASAANRGNAEHEPVASGAGLPGSADALLAPVAALALVVPGRRRRRAGLGRPGRSGRAVGLWPRSARARRGIVRSRVRRADRRPDVGGSP